MPHPAPLTELMRKALERALAHDGLRRVHDDQPGAPPWPAPAASLNACVRRGLLCRTTVVNADGLTIDKWTITDDGRDALNPAATVRPDSFWSMRALGRAGTRTMVRGVWVEQSVPEPERAEKIPARVQRPITARARLVHAQHRTLDVAAQQQLRAALSMEQRMAEAKRRARLRNVDVSHELHVIGRMLERDRLKGRAPEKARTRLEGLERRLDRPELEEAA